MHSLLPAITLSSIMAMDIKKLSFRVSKSIAILTYILIYIYTPVLKSDSSVAALHTGNETDRLALLALKNRITEDPLSVMSYWNSSSHFCAWFGVSCSNKHFGRVTTINLEGKKLSGSLPPQIGNLSFLRGINLINNNFQGQIPQEIGRLSRLRFLNLSNNGFDGEIPRNLSSCSDLQVIDLNYNKLIGEIPIELSSLAIKKLSSLTISVNNLTGIVPVWLGNASLLIELSMADNNFQGSIPVELGRLSKMQLLQIAGNNLLGTVPPNIYNLSSLRFLDVGDNQLHGTIPENIGFTLPNLLGLYVGGNQFRGSIPISLSNASGLVQLDFSFNNFTGTVPPNLGSLSGLMLLTLSRNQLGTVESDGLSFLTSLTNCSNLQTLDIGINRFKGELPSSISNFSIALEQMIAGTNQISGTIPDGIGGLIGLTRLVISKNSITGGIPAGIGKLKRLQDLRLFENKISGTIPSSLGNITGLGQLYLDRNNLDGEIPSSLGNCKQLELLRLLRNNLTGVIPKEVASLSSMTLSFNLAQNSLTGPLPSEVSSMSKLSELDVSENRLSGEIPIAISNCLMLERLILEGNLFNGSIPSALSTLTSLQVLDLSSNNLSGKIPKYLQNFTILENLNLSLNNLEGEVPNKGVFQNISAFSIFGNRNLCGGIKSLGLPACEVTVKKKQRLPRSWKVVIPVAISCSILLAFCFVVFLYLKKRNRRSLTILATDEQFRKISYGELLEATNHFSSSNLIGEGRYGCVYRGMLGSEGMTVAVKVLNVKQKGAFKSFKAECDVLKNIRHRNLIKIVTTCSSIDYKGEDFQALVYEFMLNGSLEQWLHQSEAGQTYPRNLSVTQRLSIATDVAYALEYLHHYCQTSIIHGDLKPNNILLDHDMTARVGDFGLAKFLSGGLHSNSSQNQTSSIGIRGTVGYVAPEYGMGGKASKEGDVYSFGILLLEMFTGKRPTDEIFKDGLNIHHFTKIALPRRVMEIVEPSLLSEARGDNNDVENDSSSMIKCAKIEECLVAVLSIGVSCSLDSPGERMNMRDVVAEMSRLKGKVF